MKELGMSWKEIKETPKYELLGLLRASGEHEMYHAFDGYSDEDISSMSKNNPKIRQQYIKYLETKRKYDEIIGNQQKQQGFKGII